MLNSILVIIGTIIGAGFASGKEIFTFFNHYGVGGFCGLFISGITIGIVIYKSFRIIIHYNITSYSNFVGKIFSHSDFINSIICNIINIFLFISFIIMVSGFAAYFAQEFHIPHVFGAILISFLSFITFSKNIDGLVKINKYFMPFLICIILFLGLKNWHCFTHIQYNTNLLQHGWFISALLYSSYNLIIVMPILISLKEYIKTKKSAIIVSVVTTFFLILMAIILFVLLNYYYGDIKNLELPIIFIAAKTSHLFKYICGFIILGAIFTTAISSGYGFLYNFNPKNKKNFNFLAFFMCFVSIVLSNIGFSTLLNLLYPILGVLRIYTSMFYIKIFQKALKILKFIDISM